MAARVATLADAATIAQIWNQYRARYPEFAAMSDWDEARVRELLSFADHLATLGSSSVSLWRINPPWAWALLIAGNDTTRKGLLDIANCMKLALTIASERGATWALGAHLFPPGTVTDRMVGYFTRAWGTDVVLDSNADGSVQAIFRAQIDALLARGGL